MSIKRKAPSGTFWREGVLHGRVQVKGRDIKWSLHTDDPKVARVRRKEDRDRLVAAAHHGDAKITFAEAMADWAPWVTKQVCARTAERYAVSLGQLDRFLADKRLDEIDGKLVAQIIRERQDMVTNATIKRDLVALSSVINFTIDQGWIEANPVLDRMRRLKERRDPIILPDPEHIRMVIERAPRLFAKLIEAAWKTGARQDELVRAERQHLNLDRKRLTIVGKGNKLRVIDLQPFGGIDLFRSLPQRVGPLFWHDDGAPYANVPSRFRVFIKDVAANHKDSFRPFRFHDLRHRHAVDWLTAGLSIYDLQQRLGHSSIKVTEMYLDYLTPEERRGAMYGQ